MSELSVRRLLIDLEPPLSKNWCDNDPFKTAFFNALSLSFPGGEQYFIDSVKNGLNTLPQEQQNSFKKELQGFIGQEATHRRIHTLFNNHLYKQGLSNLWQSCIEKRMAKLNHIAIVHKVAITASNEHLTAIFSNWVLSYPELFNNTEERLKNMWHWHCAEEEEHKSTAFDMYHALGGTYKSRRKWLIRCTYLFISNAIGQTIHNLKQQNSFWKLSTWKSAYNMLLSKKGFITYAYPFWKEYFKINFHPNNNQTHLSKDWLANNQNLFTIVSNN